MAHSIILYPYETGKLENLSDHFDSSLSFHFCGDDDRSVDVG
jgi:hypothetical protein